MKLQFWTFNPYQLELESVYDGDQEIYDFKSDKSYIVWSISYKQKAKESRCKGKIFFMEDGFSYNYIMTQEFDETIKK